MLCNFLNYWSSGLCPDDGKAKKSSNTEDDNCQNARISSADELHNRRNMGRLYNKLHKLLHVFP
jgi:hypothetical protein